MHPNFRDQHLLGKNKMNKVGMTCGMALVIANLTTTGGAIAAAPIKIGLLECVITEESRKLLQNN